MGKYKDHVRLQLREVFVAYRIGTNSPRCFIAESILVLASEECYIQFDNNDEDWIPVPKGDYFEWGGPILVINVKRKDVDGYIDVWSEGTIGT